MATSVVPARKANGVKGEIAPGPPLNVRVKVAIVPLRNARAKVVIGHAPMLNDAKAVIGRAPKANAAKVAIVLRRKVNGSSSPKQRITTR